MTRTLRHWQSLIGIYFRDGIVYRASLVIWILTDAATAAVLPLVMAAAARGGLIEGFSGSDFAVYYLVSLMITNFVSCHFQWEFANEIKDGMFSTYLLRPISYLQFMAMRNVAWRVVRSVVFLPILGLMVLAYWNQVQGANLYLGPEALLAIVLGHTVSFLSVMALACLAFYVQEAHSFFELYYIPMLFLSGQMFPVALFPDWARTVALATPFYYTTGLPTEIVIGRIAPADVWPLIGGQVVWCVASFVAFKLLFKRGLRDYTGTGM